MLQVAGLDVRYGGITALRGVDLEVQRGEIVTLVGANGAGKSTLLGAICGLVKPTGGSIVYQGREVAGTKAHRLARQGLILVPEGRRIFVNLSVKENLILGGYSRPRDAAFNAELERVMETFPRLAERAAQPAGTLSGGERQMLALGRGLMGSPALMMLDEPSLGLAPLMVAEVFAVIRRIHAQGVTVLLVEQNAAAALGVADRAYVLETGKVVLSGTGKELAADGRVQRAYLGME
ncbi:MAG: ABC transporter ATP-binding protein [Desulfarculaceae bacterium]|nr:ABC transporter ATP-binding protein [Desulfarculaceae bacterium]